MQAWPIEADGSAAAPITVPAGTTHLGADMTFNPPPPTEAGQWAVFDRSARAWRITSEQPQAMPAQSTDSPPPLSVLQWRQRFTLQEKAAIDMASLDDPQASTAQRTQAALLRSVLADQAAAQFIDLADPSVIEGVGLLQSMGLLSAERAAAILAP